MRTTPVRRTLTDMIDAVVLNRWLAFPAFLAVMYLMFMFTINVGSAFIDLFDLSANALFVESPRHVLQAIGLPEWLVVFLADGVGGGVQLVATFIPVIGCLFLFLSFLEDSGYMGRAAFIVDRLMRQLGLPGKSFVPLIVGFGCNVPAVMATRSLDNQQDRILTTIMAPYMSCGARLTVYALFAVAFFPNNGQNLVFGLYLLGIAVAVVSALLVRRYLMSGEVSTFVMELPAYHLPTARGLLLHTWHRLKGFVLRAGKAIVTVVVVLNVVSSVGTDGSFGNQDTEKSALSAVGKTLTPAFSPMGIEPHNWPATVGIFTGIFAKEVVVGTLDALYSGPPAEADPEFNLFSSLAAAWATVPANLAKLSDQLTDPLGLDLGDLSDSATQAADQEVTTSTLDAMRAGFATDLAAFSYLVFVLLYIPCVATVGAVYKELGGFWASFSTAWSLIMAYTLAVLCFQIGSAINATAGLPGGSLAMIASMIAVQVIGFSLLIRWGRRHVRVPELIPLTHIS
jgi:ferrous iron transport protein B